jgi:hypothetical protein
VARIDTAIEILQSELDVLDERIETLSRARDIIRNDEYFKLGDVVLMGKFKNMRGRVVGFGQDDRGHPTVEIELTSKGKKQIKTTGLYKIWRADEVVHEDEWNEEDHPRGEDGRFGSGGGGGSDGGARREALSQMFGSSNERKPLGEAAPEHWKGAYTPPAQMTRAESKAKVEELRKQVTKLQDEKNWKEALDLEQHGIPAAFRAGYQPTEEVIDPSWDEHDAISQPGHLYRGMEEAEFAATVGQGKGVLSKNFYSASSEGTSFGYEAHTANDYVNSGSSDPRRTGRPTYLVEAKANDHVTYNKTAGYPQTATGKGMPHEHITRVWKYEPREGKLHMKEIEVPRETDPEADLMEGNFGIKRGDMPQFERGTEGAFLKRMEGRGHTVDYDKTLKVADIKATQQTLHMPVVRSMSKENQQSPIIVSSDGYVLDGHHRWAAVKLRDPDGDITAHRVNLPIQSLLAEAINDPHSTRSDEWNEEDHPRDENGRFGTGGGGGGKAEQDRRAGTFKGTMYKKYEELPRTHLPKGMTKDEYTGRHTEETQARYKNAKDDELMALGQEMRNRESEWERAIERQISLGRIDPDTAQEAGWYKDGHAQEWIPLPKQMWHVTTAADKVLRTGLKTRAELAQANGKGLGGGPDGTVSFTDSEDIAKAIQTSMLEFHDLVNDKVSVKDFYEKARTGSDAKKPYAEDVLKSMSAKSLEEVMSTTKKVSEMNFGAEKPPRETMYNGNTKGEDVVVPETAWRKVGEEKGAGAERPYRTHWERDKTPHELQADKARFYKAYSFWREHAGGQIDPLFFSTDVEGFKAIPRDQIRIIEARPKTRVGGEDIKPTGYRVSALGEIRTYTGDIVSVDDYEEMVEDRKNRGIE